MSGRAARFLRFQGVGALGIVVQLGTLALFKELTHLSTALATLLAVKTAVLHNFAWHERWTWRTDRRRGPLEIARLLGKFHLGAGGVSLIVNPLLTGVLTDGFGLHYLVANGISIAAAGLVNFALNEFWVFRDS